MRYSPAIVIIKAMPKFKMFSDNVGF